MIARKFLGFTLILVLTLACAPCISAHDPVPAPAPYTPEISVWLDARFTKGERQQIRSALTRWNESLNGYARFVVRSANFAQPSVETSVPPGDFTFNWEPEDCDNHVQRNYWAWTRAVGWPEVHLVHGFVTPIVVEHEIGHALGLEHSKKAGDLMSSPMDRMATCLDDRTLGRLAELKGWNADHLKPECKL